ncbi:T9SS type A sorting domain-containing protein [Flavobacterium sp. 11]|uniref:T9SS type A sorting domain-containing protein n=1 Tax=Flavobacterium sp. 11 TaxID=357523 RepID=UPI000C180EE4|nr:T9SS type A sorting domain-containing protein [Flavobacterium sp. 11]PIF62139.1 putative secreted protein (Por secretion system target) [Flavobacterium sp. 11]
MKNNTLQQFFGALSSKNIFCFLSENMVSILNFLKINIRIPLDYQNRLGKITIRPLYFFTMVLLCSTGITLLAQNRSASQTSRLRGTIAFTDASAHTNKVSQSYNVYTQQNIISQAFILDAIGSESGFKAVKPQTANIDQIRNGSKSSPVTPGNWVNGNANATQAHYAEGWSIPYRIVMNNLVSGSHDLIIEWDIKHSGKNALDYITHYDNIDNPTGSHIATFGHSQEVIDPTAGITGLAGPNTFEIPAPSSLDSPVPDIPTSSFNALAATKKLMTIYNGTITAISYVSEGDLNDAQSSTRLKITFTTTNSTVVMAWAGHIAAEYDWGIGNGATGVSGSPYHTRLISLDGDGGNQDRSLAAAAVVSPPRCSVSGPLTACPEVANLVFNSTILNPNGSPVTYSWAFTSNTAGATFSGATTSSSVTVVPSSTDFTPGGSFEITSTVTRNGVASVCSQTVSINLSTTASAGTAPSAQCPEVGGNDFSLSGSFTNGTALWTVKTGSATGTAVGSVKSDGTTATPVVHVDGVGSVTFILTVTSNQTPSCVASTSEVTVTVNVTPTITGVLSVCVGATTQLTGSGIGATSNPWVSANPGVATVDSDGTVTGVSVGTSVITYTDSNGCQETATVAVNANPELKLKITQPSLCGSATGSIEVCSPIIGATYSLVGVPNSGIEAKEGEPVIFSGLAAGSSPTVAVETEAGCSATAACNDEDDTTNCSAPAQQAAKTTDVVAPIEAKTEAAGFTTYPVPFKDQLTVRYNFDYVSDVKIEVFDSQGISVLSKADANGFLNKEVTLDLKLNRGRDQVYVVKVTTNRGSSIKKVISTR